MKKQKFNSLYGQTENQRANKYCMTTFEAIIYNRKEIEQMKKAIKYLQIALGFIAVESMLALIFITILLKMQVFVF